VGGSSDARPLDGNCVATWNHSQCAAFALEQNVSATFLDHLRGANYSMHLFGRFDVGAGVMDTYAGTTGDGFHGGPVPVILLRGAAIPGASKPDPLNTTVTGDGDPYKSDERTAADAVAFLQSTRPPGPSDPPALVWLGVLAPHPPYDTNSSWETHVNASAVDPPPDAGPLHPYEAYQSVVKGIAGRNYTRAQQARMRRAYWGASAQATDMLLDVLRHAEAAGWLDNALVVITSDHGEMSLEHGQDYKNSLLEPSSRVPLILLPMGVAGVPPPPPGGSVVTAVTSHMDILPTLLDVAGVRPPPGGALRGASLLPYLTGAVAPDAPPPGRPPFVALQYHSNLAPGSAYGVVQRNGTSVMKLIVYGRSGLGDLPPQLFDVSADPFETDNLAGERPAAVAALNASLHSELDVPAIDAERLASDIALYAAWFHAQCSPHELLQKLSSAFKGVAEGEIADRVAAFTGGLDPRNATGGGPGTSCPNGGGG
jgi:arylsulfatase A-like enzyme